MEQGSVISAATAKSLSDLLGYSFGEMLCLLNGGQELSVRPINNGGQESSRLRSVMFTVASSNFRIVVLIHLERLGNLTGEALRHFKLEQIDSQQNQEEIFNDYVCELGNNFCGVVCRLLGEAGLSTGLSTPISLGISNSTDHLRAVGPDVESHIAAFSGSLQLISASLCLFANRGSSLHLDISIPAATEITSETGELEFF